MNDQINKDIPRQDASLMLESDEDKMMKLIGFIDKTVNEYRKQNPNKSTRHALVFTVLKHDTDQYSSSFPHAIYAKTVFYNINVMNMFRSYFSFDK